MSYTKEQVLEIIDCCFHMYASDFRTDARDTAIEIIKDMDMKNKSIVTEKECKQNYLDKPGYTNIENTNKTKNEY